MSGTLLLALVILFVVVVSAWIAGKLQGKRAVSLLLCAAMISSYIPAADVAKADTAAKPVLVDQQVLLNGSQAAQIGAVTYSVSVSGHEIDASSAQIRVRSGDEISFEGTISAPEGETISWVRVDIYDANSEEPYTVGEEYYRVSGLAVQQYDLADIPAMTIGEAFGNSDYALNEGGQYIVMFCVGDSNGNSFADQDAQIEDDQGPAVLVSVRMSPENCEHPHEYYWYVPDPSGEVRKYSYGDSLTHQVEARYERYCGLCDIYLMDIWGQGTPEEHMMADGACLACGYVDQIAPVIGSLACDAGVAFAAGTEATFTAEASDDAGLSKLELYIDGELKHSESVSGVSGTIRFSTSALTVGSHAVRVMATNAAGGISEGTLDVEVQLADSAVCTHVNTTVEQIEGYVPVDDAQHQYVITDWTHCIDCDTDISCAEEKSEPVDHDAWNEGVCETCGHTLVSSLFADMIAVELLDEQALINAAVQFKVTTADAESCKITFYNANGEVDDTWTQTLEEGVGTFSGWAGVESTETLVVSCVIDGVEYSDTLEVHYAVLGQITALPQLTLDTMPVANQPYTMSWEPVEGADWFNLFWEMPNGSSWYYGGAQTSCTVPAQYVYTTGEYHVTLEATCAGYESTYAYATATVEEKQTDSRVTLSADRTEVLYGEFVSFTISAPDAQAVRLYCNGYLWDERDSLSEAITEWPNPGKNEYYATALIDGEWSLPSESVEVTATSYGTLADPVLTVPETVIAGEDFTVSWTAVENAEEYYVGIARYDESGNASHTYGSTVEAPQTSHVFEGSQTQAGRYEVVIYAEAQGWESGYGSADIVAEEGDRLFTYEVSGSNATITGYAGASSAVEVPAQIDGYTVTCIGNSAFRDRSATAVTLPSTVVEIESDAFYNCASLTRIDIGPNVEVGKWAFENCDNLTVYGYTGSSAQMAAEYCGCAFVSVGALAEGPSFTVDKTEAVMQEDVTFTITAPGATKLRMHGYGSTEIEVQGDTTTYTRSFYSADTYTISFSALIDGVWTMQGPAQTITITDMGTLDETVITALDSIAAGAALDVSWTAVENAEEYVLYIRNAQTQSSVYSRWIDDGSMSVTVPEGELTQGEYVIEISARAAGWNSSTTEKALTVEAPEEGKEFVYTVLSDGTIRITKYLGAEATLEIPAQIDGYTVSAIGYSAFENSSVTSVTIPAGVNLESWSFSYCDNLTAVYMPKNSGSINQYAFRYSDNVKLYVYKNSTAHTMALANNLPYELYDEEAEESGITATVQEGPYYVGQWVSFSVSVPEGTEKLRVYEDGVKGSEYDVSSDEPQEIQDHLYGSATKTHYYQFSAYVNGAWTPLSEALALEVICLGKLDKPQITLPEEVYAGKELTVSWTPVENAEKYSVWLYWVNGEEIEYLSAATPKTTSHTFSASTMNRAGTIRVEVRAEALGWNNSDDAEATAEAIALSDWVYETNYWNGPAIMGYLGSDKDVVVPDEIDGNTIKVIGSDAFSGLSVESVTLSQNITTIWNDAFSNCASLTKVVIPAGVTSISNYAFNNCPQLTIYGYAGTTAQTYAQENNIPFVELEGAAEPPAFTLEPSEIHMDETVMVKVEDTQADMIRVYLDDIQRAEVSVTDGSASYALYGDYFDEVGTYEVSISARIDGVWTAKSETQTVTVTLAGVLSAPVMEDIGTQAPRTVFRIRWAPVENATEYSVRIYSEANANEYEYLYWYSELVDEDGFCYVETDTSSIIEAGSYRAVVRASASGYEDVSSECAFEVVMDSEWLYVVGDDGVTVTGYAGSDTEVTVPAQFEGVDVVAIGTGAFEDDEDLVSVVLPETVTAIGDGAFKSCYELQSVNIPAGVTSIGNEVFYYCRKLENVELPDGLVTIGEFAFSYCDALTHIDVPQSVTSIGKYAFSYCDELVTVTLPDSLEQEEFVAFESCDKLQSVVIPEGVTTVGGFGDCAELSSVQMPLSVTVLDSYAFNGCTSLTDASFVSQMTSIGYRAFEGCASIAEIVLNEELTSIEWYTFANCTSLEKATILSNVSSIDDTAFDGCAALEIWGESGSVAEQYANEHSIPFHVIGEVAKPTFTMEASSIYFDDTAVFNVSAPGAQYVRLFVDGVQYGVNHEVTDGAAQVECSFAKEHRTYEISFSAGYENGEWSAPCEAQELEVIYYGQLATPVIDAIDTVTTQMLLEESLTWFGDEHAQSYSLLLVKYNETDQEWNTGGYSNEADTNAHPYDELGIVSEGMYRVTVAAHTTERGYESSERYTEEFEVVLTQLETPKVSIPEEILLHEKAEITVEAVEHADQYDYIYYDPSGERISSLITEATSDIFSAGNDMADGTYTLEVTALSSGLYYKASEPAEMKFDVICYGTLSAPEVSVSDTVPRAATLRLDWPDVENAQQYYVNSLGTRTDSYAEFWIDANTEIGSTRLIHITAHAPGYRDSEFSKTVTIINQYAYEIVNGQAIVTAYLGEEKNVKVPGSFEGYPTAEIGDGAFEGNKYIETVTLPASVTEIGERAFKNCTSMTEITGEGVTSIGAEAFSGCTSLRYVRFGKLSYFGDRAFDGVELADDCEPLEVNIDQDSGSGGGVGGYAGNHVLGMITYPEGVTEIPDRAHYDNTRLARVYLPLSLESIGSEAFAACGELQSVRIYDKVTSIADDAFSDSPKTAFVIYVENMAEISYVEQYAIDHNIPYTKSTYGTPSTSQTDVTVEGAEEKDGEYWVRVDVPVTLWAIGEATDTAELYLNDECLGEYGFYTGRASVQHTFTSLGDVNFYAKSYIESELHETSETKIVHVYGTTFAMDKNEVWTCEPIHIEARSSETGTAYFYVDGELFGEAEIVDGKAEIDYGFRKAGERKITVKVGDYTSIERTLSVKCIDVLADPILTAEDPQQLSAGMTLSWDAVEHADGYVVRVRNASGTQIYQQEIAADGSPSMTVSVPADQLDGAGSYEAYMMAFGYQYDQSESETVSITMIEEDVCFTVDKTQVQTGEPVTFTVFAANAAQAELIVDGESIEAYEMSGNKLVFTRPFTKSGEREVTFRALINGEWSDPCDIQIISVSSAGKLDAPAPETKQYQILGSDVEVTWDTVENADGYVIRVFDENIQLVYENDRAAAAETVQSETIPSETFVSCALYTIEVIAYGAGYDQSEGGVTTEVVEHLPGPVITSPQDGGSIDDTSTELTWEAVDGALSYVVSLARRTDAVDENGEPVYEKAWASGNETVNVGTELSYLLDNLAYGEFYRAAVGTVSEGTGLDDASKVGWTECEFSVTMPKLEAQMSAAPNPAFEKTSVTITVTVSRAQSAAVLSDAAGNIYVPVRNEETENGREFDFEVSENKQGTYTYTATITGTGELAGAQQVEAPITITYLDANRAAVQEIAADPATCWPETDVRFTISANAMTQQLRIQLYQADTLLSERTTEPGIYDILMDNGDAHEFAWSYRFASAGEYTLKVTPINADNESGDVSSLTYMVLERGKLPAATVTSPKSGAIELGQDVTVTWNAVALSEEMAFGGYCILLEKKNADGVYAAVPAHTYVRTDATSYPLTGLEAGGEYRLHLFTLEEGRTEPNGTLHGETVVEFGYRTVPEFEVTAIETEGLPGSQVTVKWNAPKWEQDASLKPSRYVVWWYSPGMESGMAAELDGDQTSAVLDGAYTGTGGQYAVNVYAILSMQDGEYAQTMAGGQTVFRIASPTIESIWRGDTDVTGDYRYHRMVQGQTVCRLTYRINVTPTVEKVEVYLDGTYQNTYTATSADGQRYAEVVLPMSEGVHQIKAALPDGSSSKQTYLAVITYEEDTPMYAGPTGASLKVWPSNGWAAYKKLDANTEVTLRGMCGEYAYVRVNNSDYFVHEDDLVDEVDLSVYRIISPKDGAIVNLSEAGAFKVTWDACAQADYFVVTLIDDKTGDVLSEKKVQAQKSDAKGMADINQAIAEKAGLYGPYQTPNEQTQFTKSDFGTDFDWSKIYYVTINVVPYAE